MCAQDDKKGNLLLSTPDFAANASRDMAKSRFESLVEQEMQKIALTTVTECPAGDSHQHASLKGRYSGLGRALELFRESIKQDDLDGDKY